MRRDATVLLPGVPAPAGWVMEAQLRPFVLAGRLPFQEVIVYVNEVRTLMARLDRPARLRVVVPDGAVAPGAPITLRLRCPGAMAPRDVMASNDTRRLGVSLSRLLLG